ncbi:protein of unknown function [Paraburkholderia dioscoreae]|uniref:Uncharacterized protein n=1 Tax=Paraburkholderia dioscoreae TaxID=2604047 RepID=A0A5Q4YYG5_9BURK|nr:protein of unknown function [Paraburkholderia dioscoreae]
MAEAGGLPLTPAHPARAVTMAAAREDFSMNARMFAARQLVDGDVILLHAGRCQPHAEMTKISCRSPLRQGRRT